MMLLVASVLGSLISTAMAFDKERNVVAWYVLALVLPTVMYSLTGKYLFATAAAGLPIAILAQTRTAAKAAIRMQRSAAAH